MQCDKWQVTMSDSVNKFLPPPNEFGAGNPFLIFLCLTLLLQHRDHIMQNKMDHNELAMHFDKMVRKHNLYSVLNQAKAMFEAYLKTDTAFKENSKSQVNNPSQNC